MNKIAREGLTFDDVLVIPSNTYTDVNEICTKTKFSKNICINNPFVSAGMSTVTESRMAITVARQGGIGIIHKSLSIKEQVSEVDKVKRSEHGVITDPFYLSPNNFVYEAEELMSKYHISGVPITEHGLLVGIITNRDLRFEDDNKKKIYEIMTRDNLVTAKEGVTMEEAKEILTINKVEKLPIIDDEGYLKGLITTKDIQKSIKYPNSSKDENGRLLVAAEIDLNDETEERVKALYEAKVNAIVIGVNNNFNKIVENIKNFKMKYPDLDIVAGNVVTAKGAKVLIDAGVDAIKVGIGAGSTSTTRIITGVGVPQLSALSDVSEICKKNGVPVISDGGIKYSGDIVKAIAGGADTVLLGAILAGTEDAPNNVEHFKGSKYKTYQGISSTNSIKISNRETIEITEGVDARVTYKGDTKRTIMNTLAAFKLGMSYAGVTNIEELQNNTKFIKVSNASVQENHPHFVHITRDSENYSS